MKGYEKGVTKGLFAKLQRAPFDAARQRAPRVLADAMASGNMNPSTRLHELMDLMEKMGEPQKL